MSIFAKKSKPKIINSREVCFRIFRKNEIIHEGRFLINEEKEVSCFGSYKEIPLNDHERLPAIFEGVLLEHELIEDEVGSVLIKFYEVQPNPESAIGFKQVLYFTSALNMGAESGLAQTESVMLDEELEFVFNVHNFS